jgi:hypothetical protein
MAIIGTFISTFMATQPLFEDPNSIDQLSIEIDDLEKK